MQGAGPGIALTLYKAHCSADSVVVPHVFGLPTGMSHGSYRACVHTDRHVGRKEATESV